MLVGGCSSSSADEGTDETPLQVMQDRRLDQDDNRGMGQDVRDNKRTPNHFRLLFESKAASSSGPEHESIGFLSMNAHFSSLDLLHPPFLLPLIPRHASASLFKPLYSSLHSDLPCDVHLLNLRSLVEPGDEAPGTVLKVKASHRTALLLHRTVFSCEYGGSPLANCSANSLKVKLHVLFAFLFIYLFICFILFLFCVVLSFFVFLLFVYFFLPTMSYCIQPYH